MTFDQFHLADGTLDAVVAMGYEEPTPIQAETIPLLLKGRDVLGQARTGTGKTAAFGIPLVDQFRGERANRIVALILLPTRELALQVTEVLGDIAKGSRLAIVPVYGGAGFGKQENDLKRAGPKVLVATPGRLLDHVQRGNIDLGHVSYLVLDEADRMLDMGFVHDMRKVLKLVPAKRQTALFSATFSPPIRKLAKEFTTDAEHVSVESGETTTPLTEQFVATVSKQDKTNALLHLLAQEKPERGIIFTRTKHLAKRLAKRIANHGWSAVALQGNMTQGQRERAMDAFRKGGARLLVATDVAARGLDVPEITHVVNFDIPDVPEQYVHRIGRTGRNGSTGRAFTFIEPGQQRDLRDIEREAGRRLDQVIELDASEPGLGPDPVKPVGPVASGARPPAGGKPRRRGSHSAQAQGAPRARQGGQRNGEQSSGNRRGSRRGGRSGHARRAEHGGQRQTHQPAR